ncbi:MAG: hypothetical protein M1819_001285 [Sarea resinae]|nr:MAG: hypothetical protein M1819_001285 [Sarea resinae]
MAIETLTHSNGRGLAHGPRDSSYSHHEEPSNGDVLVNDHSDNSASIIDIRRNEIDYSILDDMFGKLRPVEGGQKTLPTLLLYDEAGLKLFEDITYLEEYYLTNAEIEVLEMYAGRMADRIQSGSFLIELGSGNLRKVNVLLKALEQRGKAVDYFALDLSLSELKRTLAKVPRTYKHVKCFGLLGTYEDGLEWLKKPENVNRPKSILSLGSSIGNFPRDEAAKFLCGFAQVLKEGDSILLGLDACTDGSKVQHAYNDREGKTHEFILNGLVHANRLLGKEAFKLDDWEVIGNYDEAEQRHQAFYSPRKDVSFDGFSFKAGEKIRVEESYKYSASNKDQLFEDAGVIESAFWSNGTGDYSVHMLSKPSFSFSLRPEEYAATAVPQLSDWEGLWAVWDTVTRRMLPEEELLSKPIKLRNACVFYLGHIPTFLDIHLTRASHGKPTSPSYYSQIFERGIDPDVDNPEHCHSHSAIPDSYPPVEEILEYQDRVRSRVKAFYESNAAKTDKTIGRALWLGYEHEAMHLETLLYMLLQSDKTLPPPGIRPDFEAMARHAKANAVPNKWFTIPQSNFTIGLDDPETPDGPERYYGFDNEKPPREIHVPSFVARGIPITNEEYATYLEQTHNSDIPASWSETKSSAIRETNGAEKKNGINGSATSVTSVSLKDKFVKTVWGRVPLAQALSWPVMASYDELAKCAKWMGGRIPTMEEVESIYRYVDQAKEFKAEKVSAEMIAAVNGHLSNNGVQISPPSNSLSPSTYFTRLPPSSAPFAHWHPLPVTPRASSLAGRSSIGGVWEWTSTPLRPHAGFEAMKLYPGYTADFFDEKHNIVLGGSWSTLPRLAGRKSL